MKNQNLRQDRNGGLKRLQKRKKLHQLSLHFVNKEIQDQFAIERAPTKQILISIVFAFQAVLNIIFLIEHAVGEDDHKRHDHDGDIDDNNSYDESNFQTYIYSISSGVFGVLFFCNFFCRQAGTIRNLKRLQSDDKNDYRSTQQQQQQQQTIPYKTTGAENNTNNNNNINNGNSCGNDINLNNNNNPISISPTPNSNCIQQEPTISSQNVSNNTSGASSSNPAKTSSFSNDRINQSSTRLLTVYLLNQFLHNIHYFIQTSLPILCFIILLSYELTLGIGGKFYNFRRADFALVQVFLSVSSLDSWPQQLILTVVSISLQFKTLSNSLGLIIILPTFLTIFYFQESRKKLLFYDYFYLQKTLAAQQKLLDHTLPCSVIVLSSKDEDSQYGSFLRLNSNKTIKDNNNNIAYGNVNNVNNSNSNNLNNSSIRRNSSQTKKSYISQFSKQPQTQSISGFNRQTSILKGINSKQKSLNYITYNNTNSIPKSPCLKRNTLIVTTAEINNNSNLLPDSERSALKETSLVKSTIVPDPACFNNIVKSTFLDPKDLKCTITNSNSNNSNIDQCSSDINQATTQSVLPNTLPFSCFNQYIDQQRNEQKAEQIRKNKEAKQQSQHQQQQKGEIELVENIDNNNTAFDTFTQQNGFQTNVTTPKPTVPFVQFASASMSFQAPQPEVNIPCTCSSPKGNDKHFERKQCICNHNNNGLGNTIQTPLFQQHQNSPLPSLFQQKYSITFSKQESSPKDNDDNASNNNDNDNKEQQLTQHKLPEKSNTGQQVQFMEQQQQSYQSQAGLSQQPQSNLNAMMTSSQRRDISVIAGQSLGDSNKENNVQSNRDIQYQRPYFSSERNQNLILEEKNMNNQLKVNFVNSTCLHSFAIQRDETSRRSRPYEGQQLRTEFFNEAQPLQDEVFQLLSQIEVKTTELLDLPFKNNSFTPLSSPFELLDTTQRHNHNGNTGNNNPKRKLISASLLDVVYQKYSLFHKKYFSQISKEVNESSNDQLTDNCIYNTNSKQQQQQQKQNDLSFEEVCKSLDLEKEDVFVNCVYRSGQTEKMLDIHIIEFQWIDEPAIMVVMTDVSQKVRARRLQDLDSYKNELLATVTHDLKTPLNGMLSILEVALELTDIKEIKNFITIVQKNGTLLNFLIMDILDYSAMLKGELRLILSRFDINDILKDITDLIGFQAQQKNLKFTISNNLPDSDCMFDNDSRRVKQILLNLTSNALKFTFSGEIAINVEKDEYSNNIVRITVSDTGVGIPDSLKPKLFKLYGTYDHNNGSNKHGVGLGLVITKKLASQVGPKDTLKLESVEKVGTSFSFAVYKSLKHIFANSGKGSGMESPGNHQNYFNNNNNSLSPIGQHNNTNNLQNRTQLPLTTPRNNLEISTAQIMRFEETSSYAKSPVAVDTQSNFYNNNTQEQCETDGPFLSQRVIHLHTPTPFFMGGKGQIQKYSQFQQYQSTPTQTTNQLGRTTPDSSEIIQGTLHKLSMSKGLDDERTTGTQRCCASFEGKGNNTTTNMININGAGIQQTAGLFSNLDRGSGGNHCEQHGISPDMHNILMDQSSEIIEIQEPSAYAPRNCQNVSNINNLSQIDITNNNSHVNVKDTPNFNSKAVQDNNEDRLSCSISNIECTGNEVDHNHQQKQDNSSNQHKNIDELPINLIQHANNNNNNINTSINFNMTNNTSNEPSYIPRTPKNIQQYTSNDIESINNNNNNYNNNNYSSSKDNNSINDADEDDDNVDANSLHNYFTNSNNFQYNGQQPPLIANTINKYGNSLSFSQKILYNHQTQYQQQQQQQQLLQVDNDSNIHNTMASSMLGGSQNLAENKDNNFLLPQINTYLPNMFQPTISNSSGSGGNNNNNQSLEIAAASGPSPKTNLRILIVDDTYFNIVALKMLLKQLKHTEVQEAYNGQQALDLLYKSKEQQQQSILEGSSQQIQTTQLIFMDINMPIMDGLECTRVIRSDPFFNSTKIVAVTAYSSAAEGQKCFDAGMDAHLCKPISKTDCQAVINSLFQQQQQP